MIESTKTNVCKTLELFNIQKVGASGSFKNVFGLVSYTHWCHCYTREYSIYIMRCFFLNTLHLFEVMLKLCQGSPGSFQKRCSLFRYPNVFLIWWHHIIMDKLAISFFSASFILVEHFINNVASLKCYPCIYSLTIVQCCCTNLIEEVCLIRVAR